MASARDRCGERFSACKAQGWRWLFIRFGPRGSCCVMCSVCFGGWWQRKKRPHVLRHALAKAAGVEVREIKP